MTIKFREMINENKDDIKTYMNWENYELNEVDLPVIEDLKDHALMVLSKSYGKFEVDPEEIYDEFCADVFMYFPNLMQQLAISRLMDAYGVVPEDTVTETFTRDENNQSTNTQSSELTLGTKTEETGTTTIDNDVSSTQNSSINIENISGVDMTGTRNVNLAHNMPEQAMIGQTGYFPTDQEGTPILSGSYVQNATESFTTQNPIDSSETSEQSQISSTTSETDSITTNNVMLQNSGTDSSETTITNEETNSVNETRTRTETNKQYAYEIKAFLESTETVNAFNNWVEEFSWVVGII